MDRPNMSLLGHLSIDELGPILDALQRSLMVQSHLELFNWLQKDVQCFIPHDIVIAAWGDFSLGLICYDIVSPLRGLRTDSFSDQTMQPFVKSLFDRWQLCGHAPFSINSCDGFDLEKLGDLETAAELRQMRAGLVHGIKDQRGRHDCLYILLGSNDLGAGKARLSLRFMLPYIDTAFRQISHLPEQYYEQRGSSSADAGHSSSQFDVNSPVGGLSGREMEIMEWVRMGKTNHEIGMILDISAFTVKNHMQRIFKKLDVMNRAQAVSKLETYRHLLAR